jgi:geranylgeranyl diphosphate synthase, type II
VDVTAYLAERAALVDRFLDAELPPASEEPAALHAAMRHLLFPGGKRLRPAFAFAACEAVGSPPERALAIAGAVELVHVYSLVHDDLPCMDDDDLRRGKPTVHVAFGEAVAVLAGDALQAQAFELLARAGAGISDEARLAAVAELAHAAGSRALVGGQAEDLAFAGGDGGIVQIERGIERVGVEQIERIHERKTAALFAAACAGGARFGGANAEITARLRRFGVAVGAAFQAADDVLDAGKDEACTLVRPLGVEGTRARAAERLAEGLRELESFGERAEPLRDLARFAVAREH